MRLINKYTFYSLTNVNNYTLRLASSLINTLQALNNSDKWTEALLD